MPPYYVPQTSGEFLADKLLQEASLANQRQALESARMNQALAQKMAPLQQQMQEAQYRKLQQDLDPVYQAQQQQVQLANRLAEIKAVESLRQQAAGPKTFEVNGNLVVQDPASPGGFKTVFTAPVAQKPTTYQYEVREDGTYAIPSNDPFNAVRVNVGGSPLSGKTAASKAPSWSYETREDGTYAISSDNPTIAHRVTMADGTPDPTGMANVISAGTPLPGKPTKTAIREIDRAGSENLSSAKTAFDQLQNLKTEVEKNKNLFGPIAGRVSMRGPYDVKRESLRGKIKTVAQAIGKYMEGGVLRKEDEIKYEEMLGGLEALPDTVLNKLGNVDQFLNQKYTNDLTGYQQSGYDIARFPKALGKAASKVPVGATVRQGGKLYQFDGTNYVEVK